MSIKGFQMTDSLVGARPDGQLKVIWMEPLSVYPKAELVQIHTAVPLCLAQTPFKSETKPSVSKILPNHHTLLPRIFSSEIGVSRVCWFCAGMKLEKANQPGGHAKSPDLWHPMDS